MSPRSNRPACVVCQRPCVPLADYDAPVCYRCDAAWEGVLTRAQLVDAFAAPTVVTAAPPSALPEWLEGLPAVAGCGTPRGYLEHVDAGELPCTPCSHFYGIAVANAAAWRVAREAADLERTHAA